MEEMFGSGGQAKIASKAAGSELMKNIEAFEFPEEGSAMGFEEKLSQENGWTLPQARMAAREYGRFVYLTQTAGAMVCPSDEVDQAWHMHLTMTGSYQRFCAMLPGGFLHHQASKGGSDELARHKAMYEFTLGAYESAFGAAAPKEWWPGVDERFRLGAKSERWAAQASWSIRWPFESTFLSMLCAAALGWACSGAWSASTLEGVSGSQFMAVFFAALFAAAWLPALIKSASKQAGAKPLEAYEAAMLSGGSSRAAAAIMARLVAQGSLKLEAQRDKNKISGGKCVKVEGASAAGLSSLEIEALAGAPSGGVAVEVGHLQKGAADRLGMMAHRLGEAGLFAEAGRALARSGWGALACLGVAAVGFSRLFHGIEMHRPVGLLVGGLALAWLVARYHATRSISMLTDAGDASLEAAKNKHEPLKKGAPLEGSDDAGSPLLAMGVALYGSEALMSHEQFAGINYAYGKGANATGSSGSGGGGGGSGCSGGGGGGGGGCGGGGCGGCGG